MWLKKLRIQNFRNFSHLNLEFSAHLNVLEGENGQGKTNLLEAIYCVDQGTSYRTSNEQELIKWGEDNLYLQGEGEKKDVSLKCEFSLGKDHPKKRKVNSRVVSLRDNKWWLWTIVFSTQDMRIVQGSPFYRRNFIDEVLSFLYLDFTHLRFSFNRVLNQRNALLDLIKKGKKIKEEGFEGWNYQFLDLGSRIVFLRLEGLKKLSFYFQKIFSQLMGTPIFSHLIYVSSFLDQQKIKDASYEKIKEQFSYELIRVKEKEKERGITLIGPHRDDFKIEINKVNLRSFGSQGEQRIATLALKLAEAVLIKDEEKEMPVVLMDDITSDLDPQKENFLLNTIKKMGQLFVTTQDISKFNSDFLQDSLIFHIKEGKVILNDR